MAKKDGFGNHSEATINLNLKLNYENLLYSFLRRPLFILTLNMFKLT